MFTKLRNKFENETKHNSSLQNENDSEINKIFHAQPRCFKNIAEYRASLALI